VWGVWCVVGVSFGCLRGALVVGCLWGVVREFGFCFLWCVVLFVFFWFCCVVVGYWGAWVVLLVGVVVRSADEVWRGFGVVSGFLCWLGVEWGWVICFLMVVGFFVGCARLFGGYVLCLEVLRCRRVGCSVLG